MSWDALLMRDENGSEAIATYAVACDWIRSSWTVETWADGVNQPIYCSASGYGVEVTLGTRRKDEKVKYYQSLPPPADDPDKLEQWALEISTGLHCEILPEEPVTSISLNVRGGGDPREDIMSFCKKHNLGCFDMQSGEWHASTAMLSDTFSDWRNYSSWLGSTDVSGG